jgi:hypothetical protein
MAFYVCATQMDEIKEEISRVRIQRRKSLSAWSSGFGALRWAPKENEREECANIGMGEICVRRCEHFVTILENLLRFHTYRDISYCLLFTLNYNL